MEAMGPKSKKLLAEIEELETKRGEVSKEVGKLTWDVVDREKKLNLARAQGLVGKVDRDQVAAFESELKKLQAELAKARSTLAGLDQMVAEKRQALEQAKIADAQEALTTEDMKAALGELEKNAKALEKARAAFLKALEAGAAALLEEIAPHRAQWERLVGDRRGFYQQRRRALGPGGSPFEDAYWRMEKDPISSRPFGDPGDIPQAAALAEMLRPLLDQGRGK